MLVKCGTPPCMREDSVLLRSQSTEWFGWLPKREIDLSVVGDDND
jgi:hypothetical protein